LQILPYAISHGAADRASTATARMMACPAFGCQENPMPADDRRLWTKQLRLGHAPRSVFGSRGPRGGRREGMLEPALNDEKVC
jgi:hypothetical protein